jgi:hypothetical protein
MADDDDDDTTTSDVDMEQDVISLGPGPVVGKGEEEKKEEEKQANPVAVASMIVTNKPNVHVSLDRLSKRHKRLLAFLWSNTDVHMPQSAVCKGIAALLGVQQKLVTAWFGQQRARERSNATGGQSDENMIVAVHSMNEVVSVDMMNQFVQSVKIIVDSGGRILPAHASHVSATKSHPTVAVAVAPDATMATTSSSSSPEPGGVATVRIVRVGATVGTNDATRAAAAAATKRTRKTHTPEQVELMARAFTREPRLQRAAFRSTKAGAAMLERLEVQMGGRLTRQSIVGWMTRRQEKVNKMVFPHEDTLNHCFVSMRQLMIDELAKYVLPWVLTDPKVLLHTGTGCKAFLIWRHLAPEAWQIYALAHMDEFVRWVPRLLRQELGAQTLRHALRQELFAWSQCDGRYVEQPIISWQAFETHPALSNPITHEQILSRNLYALIELENDSDRATDPWHSIFFPMAPIAKPPTDAILRCLASCIWLRRIDALLSDRLLDALGVFLQDFFALFTTRATHAIYTPEIYHTLITRAQAWLGTLVERQLLTNDTMEQLVHTCLHWAVQVHARLTHSLIVTCNQKQFAEPCREFFQHLPGYLERQAARHQPLNRNQRTTDDDSTHEHEHEDDGASELPRAHAAQFHLPTQQELDNALVQLGQDLLGATPSATAAIANATTATHA